MCKWLCYYFSKRGQSHIRRWQFYPLMYERIRALTNQIKLRQLLYVERGLTWTDISWLWGRRRTGGVSNQTESRFRGCSLTPFLLFRWRYFLTFWRDPTISSRFSPLLAVLILGRCEGAWKGGGPRFGGGGAEGVGWRCRRDLISALLIIIIAK